MTVFSGWIGGEHSAIPTRPSFGVSVLANAAFLRGRTSFLELSSILLHPFAILLSLFEWQICYKMENDGFKLSFLQLLGTFEINMALRNSSLPSHSCFGPMLENMAPIGKRVGSEQVHSDLLSPESVKTRISWRSWYIGHGNPTLNWLVVPNHFEIWLVKCCLSPQVKEGRLAD